MGQMNAFISDLYGESYLEHFGVKGMKWGVRRYQNKDGSLTSLGRKRLRFSKNTLKYIDESSDDVQNIVDSISDKERSLLGGKTGTAYLKKEEGRDVVKRFIEKNGNVPVAFLDIYRGSPGSGSIVIVTKSGKEYRGKGYASKLVTKAQKWLDTEEARNLMEINSLDWFSYKENEPSIALSKKYGFSEREDYKNDPEWYGARYKKR